MESRVIIFLVLSLTIIFAYPYFLAKMGIATPDSQPITQGDPSGPSTAKGAGKTGTLGSDVPSSNSKSGSLNTEASEALALKEGEPLPPTKEVAEQLKVIEGDLYRVVLSSRGGTVKEWALKKYTKKDEKGAEHPIQMMPPTGTIRPLAIAASNDDALKEVPYSLDETKLELSQSLPTGTVVMTAALPDGRSITKELTFYNDRYQADIVITTSGLSEYDLALGSNFGITDWETHMGGAAGAISMVDGQKVSEHPEQTTVTHDKVSWFGLGDTYFMSALMPLASTREKGPAGGGAAVSGEGNMFKSVSVQGISETEIAASVQMTAQNGRAHRLTLYAGPKEYDRLVAYHNFLEEAIDFGWFIAGSWLPVRLVAKPLFYILRFIYGVTQNYGWAIILLTIFLKGIFHPITKKSLVSMKQMAALQPKVAVIREKWADNKEKMNKELMNLYRDSGVNPMGGCLPMLLQMPVFVALFNILYVTIDLKNAPFIFWIYDLSSKDPYYVLPIIMGVTMILQQMTQPSAMDPMQAKIMMFMPVVYTFFFLTFPSGLVLYWLVNNILSIAQQYWINRQVPASA